MLFLFLVKRDVEHDDEARWDAAHGFVIAAMNELEARIIASSRCRGDQSPYIWHALTTSCTRIGVAENNVTSGVILCDYHSG